MIEEGLYDNEPSYVRATIYERVFQCIPFAGYEAHDSLIDREKLEQWLLDHKFAKHHSKMAKYHEDGEQRYTLYYVNKDRKEMISIRRSYIDPSKPVDVMSSDDNYLGKEKEKNPNFIAWISFYSTSEDAVNEFKTFFEGIGIKDETKNKIYMLKSNSYGGLELEPFPITINTDTSIELNYGTGFLKTYDKIVDTIKTKISGLYIFHGPPGTGKTSALKHLTTIIENRKFIFVPNTLVAELFTPKLVDKLYSFKNSVLVLEDAEICIFKRNGTNNELVSGLLNITDGLLKDLLNISIIVTFNAAEISEIDPALLRKGRLKIMHKFDLLSITDAKKLAIHLKKKSPVTKPMSLADVYNLDEDTGLEENEPKHVGFAR
jgi:hypothetical protein